MKEILKYVYDKFIADSFGFLYFLGGFILGTVVVYLIYRIVGKKKRKATDGEPIKDVSDILSDGIELYRKNGNGLDVEKKVSAITESLEYMSNKICDRYYPEGKKVHTVVKSGKFVGDGISLPLNFTVYEALGFMSALVDTLQKNFERTLSSTEFSLAYGAYRLINKKIDEKNPKNLKLSTVAEIFLTPKPEKKEKSKVKEFFGGVMKKVATPFIEMGKRIVLPTAEKIVDVLVEGVVDDIGENINYLYSHNLGEVATTLSTEGEKGYDK